MFGTEEQKKKWLPDLLTGRKVGAFCLTEPDAGTDASRQLATAVDMGDHYLLNAHKKFITNGGIAGTYLVFAMTDKSKGNMGISAFIVDAESEGVSTGKLEQKMGIRSSQTAEMHFDNVKVPKDCLLGQFLKPKRSVIAFREVSVFVKPADGSGLFLHAGKLGFYFAECLHISCFSLHARSPPHCKNGLPARPGHKNPPWRTDTAHSEAEQYSPY